MGPHLKNTFALAHQDTVYLSQHMGDLDSLETLRHFQESLRRFRTLFRIDPEVVVRDLHPGYLSTRLAEEIADDLGSKEVMAVQHHHAHVAAVLAEHGETGPVVGLAFDGTGYGEDGRVWGAEVLVSDLESYRRAGHLRYGPLPGEKRRSGTHGGRFWDTSPWSRNARGISALPSPAFPRRTGGSWPGRRPLVSTLPWHRPWGASLMPLPPSWASGTDAATRGRRRWNWKRSPGNRRAIEGCRFGGPALEQALPRGGHLPFPAVRDASGMFIMDPLPLLSGLGKARQDGVSMALLATGFHRAVARTSADLAARLCEEEGLTTVALCGGVFQNALLLGTVKRMVEDRGSGS